MGKRAQSVLVVIGTYGVLALFEHFFGRGVSLFVAIAALSFCIGALWGAGSLKRELQND